MVFLLISAVCAADQQAASPAKVSLQFDNVDASEALVSLAQKAQVTVLGDASVKGKVNCGLNDVTVDQALDAICKTNKLEWYKAYVDAPAQGEKLDVAKIFTLLDALKALGKASLVCQDPSKQQETVFISGAKVGAVNAAPMSEALNLKPVYLVRAIPQPAPPADAAKQTPSQLGVPPADVMGAATQVWDYFSQMPADKQFQVMREVGRMMWQNMSPEQLDRMREMMRGGRGDGGNWRGGGRPDGRRDGQR